MRDDNIGRTTPDGGTSCRNCTFVATVWKASSARLRRLCNPNIHSEDQILSTHTCREFWAAMPITAHISPNYDAELQRAKLEEYYVSLEHIILRKI